MAIAATDAADRVEQLIVLSDRLTGFVEREIALLDAKRTADVKTVRDEAAPLANLYRQETARIGADRSLIADAPETRRRALRQATENFHTALERHDAALAAVREVTEGLVHAIADHVARTRLEGAGYGPATADARARAGAAITLNQTA